MKSMAAMSGHKIPNQRNLNPHSKIVSRNQERIRYFSTDESARPG